MRVGALDHLALAGHDRLTGAKVPPAGRERKVVILHVAVVAGGGDGDSVLISGRNAYLWLPLAQVSRSRAVGLVAGRGRRKWLELGPRRKADGFRAPARGEFSRE